MRNHEAEKVEKWQSSLLLIDLQIIFLINWLIFKKSYLIQKGKKKNANFVGQIKQKKRHFKVKFWRINQLSVEHLIDSSTNRCSCVSLPHL